MSATNWYRPTVIVLFVLFVVANSAWLHRVPGLMGDEASEGENVYLLFDAKQLFITGERSYIGPFIDYIRVPFVEMLGYTPLALRIVMLLFSVATFWLAVIICRRLWGQEVGLVAATAMLFSPIYLTSQRLGWAITLLPFFALLTLYLLTLPEASRLKRHGPLLAGLSAGLGLHNHAIFLPTLAGVAVGWVSAVMWQRHFTKLFAAWPALVGLLAGFGTQLSVMMINRGDYKDAILATADFSERLAALPQLLPLLISGSSYAAYYTGWELSRPAALSIAGIIFGLVLAALFMPRRKGTSLVWTFGLVILLSVLLYMIFQFSLRYFVTFGLGVWLLGGVGLGTLLLKPGFNGKKPGFFAALLPIILAFALMAWTGSTVLVPYLKTGGSTGNFSLGNRRDSAAALIATRPLVECLRGAGSVWAHNIHIQNRLRYLRYDPRHELEVAAGEEQATLLISYRLVGDPPADAERELCPVLKHWRV